MSPFQPLRPRRTWYRRQCTTRVDHSRLSRGSQQSTGNVMVVHHDVLDAITFTAHHDDCLCNGVLRGFDKIERPQPNVKRDLDSAFLGNPSDHCGRMHHRGQSRLRSIWATILCCARGFHWLLFHCSFHATACILCARDLTAGAMPDCMSILEAPLLSPRFTNSAMMNGPSIRPGLWQVVAESPIASTLAELQYTVIGTPPLGLRSEPAK